MAEGYRQNPAEKSKLLVALPSFLNLRDELDLDNDDLHPNVDRSEVLKTLMLQIFCQLEKFSSNETNLVSEFNKWLNTYILNHNSDVHRFVNQVEGKKKLNKNNIKAIRKDIDELMVFNDEPTNCESTTTDEDHSTNVFLNKGIIADGFMYNDEKSFLEKNNFQSKYRCTACGSNNTKPLELLSHSASTDSLIQLFTFRLPDLDEKKLLDIGSGLGSILYGAFYFSKASEITGIELNSGFCKIVDKIIKKYGMKQRVKVMDGDLKNYADILKVQDVVVFNNAFEYFIPIFVQVELWQFIYTNMKSGSFLVTNPDLDTVLKPLVNIGFVCSEWVSEMLNANVDFEVLSGLEQTDEKFHVYIVK